MHNSSRYLEVGHASMNFSKDLVPASATPIILAILQNQESYGYAIIRKVQNISSHKIEWTEGMLYPVLHRLESSALIYSQWRKSENGRKRKYYHITNEGIQELEALKSQWAVIHQALQVLEDEGKGVFDHV